MAYDDGFLWSDAYTECDEMLESCVLTYLLAELRSLVRLGEATPKTEAVLDMPLSAKDLMRLVNTNQHLLARGLKHSTNSEPAQKASFNQELLKTTDERSMRIKRANKQRNKNLEPPTKEENITQGKPIISPSMYVAFDDDFKKEELYYSVAVNHISRRIAVCFRGSVVSNVDWATDFDTSMKEVKNPTKMHSSQQPTMKIHSKLHDLLYAPSSRRPLNEATGELCPVFMEILAHRIRPIMQTYPGYKVSAKILFAIRFAAANDFFLHIILHDIVILVVRNRTQPWRGNSYIICVLGSRRARCNYPKTSFLCIDCLSLRWGRVLPSSPSNAGRVG